MLVKGSCLDILGNCNKYIAKADVILLSNFLFNSGVGTTISASGFVFLFCTLSMVIILFFTPELSNNSDLILKYLYTSFKYRKLACA